MNNSIKAYLNNNWHLVKFGYITDNSCYWWKEYMNFIIFLYDNSYYLNIDIIDHDRENIKPKRPPGHYQYFKKYGNWITFDFKQFKLMMNDLELYDKKLSIKKKLNTIKKDF